MVDVFSARSVVWATAVRPFFAFFWLCVTAQNESPKHHHQRTFYKKLSSYRAHTSFSLSLSFKNNPHNRISNVTRVKKKKKKKKNNV
tara:strand:+ start:445 stop:705 length:261 start_codon:yes stop_codon:yes gene_type:complete